MLRVPLGPKIYSNFWTPFLFRRERLEGKAGLKILNHILFYLFRIGQFTGLCDACFRDLLHDLEKCNADPVAIAECFVSKVNTILPLYVSMSLFQHQRRITDFFSWFNFLIDVIL